MKLPAPGLQFGGQHQASVRGKVGVDRRQPRRLRRETRRRTDLFQRRDRPLSRERRDHRPDPRAASLVRVHVFTPGLPARGGLGPDLPAPPAVLALAKVSGHIDRRYIEVSLRRLEPQVANCRRTVSPPLRREPPPCPTRCLILLQSKPTYGGFMYDWLFVIAILLQ